MSSFTVKASDLTMFWFLLLIFLPLKSQQKMEAGKKRSGSLSDADTANKKGSTIVAVEEDQDRQVTDEDNYDLSTREDCMRLVRKSYADLQDSQYLAMALLLKFILGCKKHGCNLFDGEVRTIITAERARGRGSILGAAVCSVMSDIANLHVQVGSPNVSVYAMLVVDIDHEALKERWGITGEVPGSKFRNFCNYDFVKYGGCKDPDRAQTRMAPWFAEACRYAYPWGHFPGFPAEMPEDLRERLLTSRIERRPTSVELVRICDFFMTEVQLPEIYP